MTSVPLFVLVAFRAVIELIVWLIVGRAVLALLITLTGQPTAEAGVDGAQLAADLPALLHGQGQHHGDCTRRLSDTALVKLFRLLRLARRLLDLEAGTTAPGT